MAETPLTQEEFATDPNDRDVLEMSRTDLIETVLRLREAIRADRDATGHQLCWYRPELWDLLPDKVEPTPTVPPHDEFIKACHLFRKSLDPV
jgi:hypothetical protein